MIKATIIADSEGTEFKTPKETFIWLAFTNTDKTTIAVQCTFHKSKEDAEKNNITISDTPRHIGIMLTGKYNVPISEVDGRAGFEVMKKKITEKVIEIMKAEHLTGKFTHVSKFEIV